MNLRPVGRPPRSPRSSADRPFRRAAAAAAVVALGLAGLTACDSASGSDAPQLAADADLPAKVPAGTVLRVGDPATETAIKAAGLDQELEDEGVKVEWANISGGPKTLEAFRAHALDVGSAQDIPPLFAEWTGTDVRIVATSSRADALNHAVYQLGIAPSVDVRSLADLKGKKIAYSPGQAQGALVLRVLAEAGLTQDDVELVEMQSVDDVYVNAVGSKQVDVAPLGGTLLTQYLAKYGQDGGTALPTGIRDDQSLLYAPVETVQDAGKAAALAKYVVVWAEAKQWANAHPDEYAQAFYVDHEGLSLEDGKALVEQAGTIQVPVDWTQTIAAHQETADLLAEEQDHDQLEVENLYDRRYEKAVADALGATATDDGFLS
jgi:sulfonate transport system substrate-binding protein